MLLIAQTTEATFTELKLVPISDQELKEADAKYKEQLLKEERRQRYLASIKEIDSSLLEESFEQAPSKLKRIIYGMLNKEKFASHYKNILLTGPSGSGKSTLAEAIAFKLQRKCIVIDAPSLLGRYRDQAAENILKLFKQIAADPDKPVLVINEINAFTDDHTSEHSDTKHTAMQLWTLVDKHSKDPDFLLIGTTNITKKMPHQLQSRFEGKTFFIENSFVDARLRAISFYMKKLHINTDGSCTDEFLKIFIEKLDVFSTRGLEALVNRAHLCSIIQNNSSRTTAISKENFEQAYQELIEERIQFWDFSEQTTDEERRHKENLAQNAKQFSEGQDLQINLAEWNMLYQALIKPLENNNTPGLSWEKLVSQLNLSKSIVLPNKKAAAKLKTIPWKAIFGLFRGTETVFDFDDNSDTQLN
jgi:AAA+ superfamily predicted ATPase